MKFEIIYNASVATVSWKSGASFKLLKSKDNQENDDFSRILVEELTDNQKNIC